MNPNPNDRRRRPEDDLVGPRRLDPEEKPPRTLLWYLIWVGVVATGLSGTCFLASVLRLLGVL